MRGRWLWVLGFAVVLLQLVVLAASASASEQKMTHDEPVWVSPWLQNDDGSIGVSLYVELRQTHVVRRYDGKTVYNAKDVITRWCEWWYSCSAGACTFNNGDCFFREDGVEPWNFFVDDRMFSAWFAGSSFNMTVLDPDQVRDVNRNGSDRPRAIRTAVRYSDHERSSYNTGCGSLILPLPDGRVFKGCGQQLWSGKTTSNTVNP